MVKSFELIKKNSFILHTKEAVFNILTLENIKLCLASICTKQKQTKIMMLMLHVVSNIPDGVKIKCLPFSNIQISETVFLIGVHFCFPLQ